MTPAQLALLESALNRWLSVRVAAGVLSNSVTQRTIRDCADIELELAIHAFKSFLSIVTSEEIAIDAIDGYGAADPCDVIECDQPACCSFRGHDYCEQHYVSAYTEAAK